MSHDVDEISLQSKNDDKLNPKSRLDFSISTQLLRKNLKAINRELVDKTLFVLPRNDGEAKRSSQILDCIKAPYVHLSHQSWGATLDREMAKIHWDQYPNIQRVLVFEMPGKETRGSELASEQDIRDRGLDLHVIDHHQYHWIDRRHELSSLEQLCRWIGWQIGFTDLAVAVNDRSYIAGLKELGLTRAEIVEIRNYDLLSQGFSRSTIERHSKNIPEYIEKLTKLKKGNLWLLEDSPIPRSFILQELALNSESGVVHIFERRKNKLGFSGSPKIVALLNDINFCDFGIAPGYTVYSGGDDRYTKFWGFRPKGGHETLTVEDFNHIVGKISQSLEPKQS